VWRQSQKSYYYIPVIDKPTRLFGDTSSVRCGDDRVSSGHDRRPANGEMDGGRYPQKAFASRRPASIGVRYGARFGFVDWTGNVKPERFYVLRFYLGGGHDILVCLMSDARRFPPPWTVEELDACFIVRDHDGQVLAYVYFEDEPGRRSAAKLLTKDEARLGRSVLAHRRAYSRVQTH
jgi:hypothetical protein